MSSFYLYDLSIFHLSEIFLAFYLVYYISYSQLVVSSNDLSFPYITNATTLFSIFTLFLLIFFTDFSGLVFLAPYSHLAGFSNVALLSLFFKTVAVIASFGVLIISREYLLINTRLSYEIDLMTVFSILGILLIGSCNDFLSFYLAIELQSLVFYTLASFLRDSGFSAEAGLKYLVLGAFASSILLFAIALFYMTFGTVCFESLLKLSCFSHNYATGFLGFLFLLLALAFKLGAAPFHMWLCDVYEGSMIAITALFSAVPKVVIFGLLIRLLYVTFEIYGHYSSFLMLAFGLGSICFASIAALYQKRMKRLLAYSAISNTGFVLLALACSSTDSVKSSVIYITLYVVMTLAVFTILLSSVSSKNTPKYLINWSLLSGRNFCLAIGFVLTLFSIGGIPPMAGFFSKLGILFALLGQKYVVTSIVVITFSSIACFYYIRLVKLFYFTNAACGNFWIDKHGKSLGYIFSPLVFLMSLFFLRPTFLFELSTILVISLL